MTHKLLKTNSRVISILKHLNGRRYNCYSVKHKRVIIKEKNITCHTAPVTTYKEIHNSTPALTSHVYHDKQIRYANRGTSLCTSICQKRSLYVCTNICFCMSYLFIITYITCKCWWSLVDFLVNCHWCCIAGQFIYLLYV